MSEMPPRINPKSLENDALHMHEGQVLEPKGDTQRFLRPVPAETGKPEKEDVPELEGFTGVYSPESDPRIRDAAKEQVQKAIDEMVLAYIKEIGITKIDRKNPDAVLEKIDEYRKNLIKTAEGYDVDWIIEAMQGKRDLREMREVIRTELIDLQENAPSSTASEPTRQDRVGSDDASKRARAA